MIAEAVLRVIGASVITGEKIAEHLRVSPRLVVAALNDLRAAGRVERMVPGHPYPDGVAYWYQPEIPA